MMMTEAILTDKVHAQLAHIKQEFKQQATARQLQFQQQREQLVRELVMYQRREQLKLMQLRDQGIERALDLGQQVLTQAIVRLERMELARPALAKVRLVAVGHKQLEVWREQVAAFIERLSSPGIDGYDGLNVKQVNDHLDGLDTYGLSKLRFYERANKNRVTVLREVERRLESQGLELEVN